ncbi:MAG TPA: extracellular solute-binding protein [Gaiellaceae bacterium]|nr:extracellular solute-binding protein [Gaiellaceae bacterium]
MSEEYEYDPYEYAKALEEGEDLGRSDLDEHWRLTRRDLLVKGGAGAAAIAGSGALAGAAAAAADSDNSVDKNGKFTGTLRVLTLGVEFPIPDIAKQASKDLGFTVKPILAPSEKQPQIAITSPDTFDVFGGYNYQSLLVWPSGGLQPVDTRRIPSWKGFYKLFTYGKLNPASTRCTYGQGNAPFRTTFVDPQGSTNGIGNSTGLPVYSNGPTSNKEIIRWIGEDGKPIKGKPEPRWIVGPAAHFNADSMGYNADVIQKRPEQVSWAELLNTKWKGRVSLLRDPGIMSQDAGAAVTALGLMKIKDYGNPTKAEIDRLFKILTKYKKQGQFRAFWSAFTDSVNFMVSKEVVIESMWSPAVALVKAAGVNVLYAVPPEGFRGWCSAEGISSAVKDPAKLQACYDYINWNYNGFLGAVIMRQGYYIANGQKLLPWIKSAAGKKAGFSPAEYDYWWGGKPAPRDLPGITGKVGDIKKGERREGGSFQQRICKYYSWNSFGRNADYLTKRVNDFLSA